MTDAEAQGVYLLLREGYKWKEIEDMTPAQINFILAGILIDSKKTASELKKPMRKGRVR